MAPDAPEYERFRLERDLYLGLLNLTDREDAGAFLEEALRLIVGVLDAQQVYLEVSDPHEGPSWWRAAGCSDEQVETIRTIVSRGIIAEALALGEVVECPSAVLDPRFRDRQSVRASKIEAVLCVPIVQRTRTPLGVLYIQGRRGGGGFSNDDVERAKTLARHMAPLVESLFMRSRSSPVDHVAPFRSRLRLDDVVGKSAALAAVLREVELVAPLDVAVLITGETGSGKTQLARIIHDNSPRRAHRLIEINCSAIPDTLIESELFGAMPGAHSTAARRMEGKVGAAEGGTLFLDEIDLLSQSAQSKLLQFLNTRDYFPLGSSTALTANVRIIAATNSDLDEAVQQRRFREDLFFRLNVLTIRMPSLAERAEDVAPMAQALCERAQRAHRIKPLPLSPGALHAITTGSFRGNVRELAHVVEVAAIRASAEGGASAIEAGHVFRPTPSSPSGRPLQTFHEETRRFQANLVARALEATDWNVSAAARNLDVTRAHLYNLIKSFGLTRDRTAP
jgi:Nif-specific regulatory protein